jgi:His-Xaa-Ser repeat protein HxsA
MRFDNNREGHHMIKTSVLAATALAALLAGAPAFAQSTAPAPSAAPPSSAAPTPQPSTSAPPSASSQASAPQHSSASGGTVQSAQQALQQGGFYKGSVDGKMGPHTRQAIRSFQQSKGLHATGHLNQKTLTALGVTG